MPVYVATQAGAIRDARGTVVAATAGVLVGTFWGVRLLRRIPESQFRRGVAVLVLALGLYMLARGITRAA